MGLLSFVLGVSGLALVSAPLLRKRARACRPAPAWLVPALTVLVAALTASCATDKPSKPAGPPALTLQASADSDSGAAPLAVNFQATAGGGVPPYGYLWAFGDGAVSAIQNPAHTYQHSGAYGAVLTANDAADPPSTLSDTVSVTVLPEAELTCAASADPRSGVFPLEVTFDASASGGKPPYSYAWTFGDGGASILQSPRHLYDDVGSYQAVLTVVDSEEPPQSCHDDLTIFATFPLECDASPDSVVGLLPLTVNFVGFASGGRAPYTYAWDFGDGSASTQSNPTKTYDASGVFVVTLTTLDASDPPQACSDTASVTAFGPMECGATGAPTSGLAPLSVDFQGSASGGLTPYFFFWNFGDGRVAFQRNPTHQYVNAGSYVATLTVGDAETPVRSCFSTVPVTVTAVLECVSSADPAEGIAPLEVAFSSTATGGTPPLSYHWSFGDGDESASQSPSHLFEGAGTFESIVTVSDEGTPPQSCSDTVAVVVLAPLQCAASSDIHGGSVPLGVAFNANVTGGTPPYAYSWDFGDGYSSHIPSVIHIYTRPGSYHVTLAVEDADTPPQTCQDASLEITATGGGLSPR